MAFGASVPRPTPHGARSTCSTSCATCETATWCSRPPGQSVVARRRWTTTMPSGISPSTGTMRPGRPRPPAGRSGAPSHGPPRVHPPGSPCRRRCGRAEALHPRQRTARAVAGGPCGLRPSMSDRRVDAEHGERRRFKSSIRPRGHRRAPAAPRGQNTRVSRPARKHCWFVAVKRGILVPCRRVREKGKCRRMQ